MRRKPNKPRQPTRVHTGRGGALTSQAALVVTQIGGGVEDGGEMQLQAYGDGPAREVIDGVIEAMKDLMRSDPDFRFPGGRR